MTISPEKVWFDEDNLRVFLSDGRTVGSYPTLLRRRSQIFWCDNLVG